MTKYCPCCTDTKALTEFYHTKGKPQSYCKSCWKQKAKTAYVKPDKKKTKAYTLKSKFGITLEKYHELYTQQNGCCAICSKQITLYAETRDLSDVACVDHNHTTGEVRGLLCNHCNTGIGLLQEDVYILEAASKYLKDKGSK